MQREAGDIHVVDRVRRIQGSQLHSESFAMASLDANGASRLKEFS